MIFVALICGSIAAANAGMALAIPGARLLLAIFALHCSGFFFGYLVSRLFGADEAKARTISIETGPLDAMSVPFNRSFNRRYAEQCSCLGSGGSLPRPEANSSTGLCLRHNAQSHRIVSRCDMEEKKAQCILKIVV